MIPDPINIPQVFAIEGLDRLGKSTLIEGIKNTLGFYQVVHFSKPEKLTRYSSLQESTYDDIDDPLGVLADPMYIYQRESFLNSFILATSGGRLIYDRWHLGEAVYAPLYRKYEGDYVFNLEKHFELQMLNRVRLILLTEDFSKSNHFVSDGESFDDSKRATEQALFEGAFAKSCIKDKRIICVTAGDGGFRSKEDILKEALA
jgi:thymidylate kinase